MALPVILPSLLWLAPAVWMIMLYRHRGTWAGHRVVISPVTVAG